MKNRKKIKEGRGGKRFNKTIFRIKLSLILCIMGLLILSLFLLGCESLAEECEKQGGEIHTTQISDGMVMHQCVPIGEEPSIEVVDIIHIK